MKHLIVFILNILKLFTRPSLPHPQEKVDYSQTTENIDVNSVVRKWLADWQVPEQYHADWLMKPIKIDTGLPCPAWVYNGILSVRPEWCNPGVIAHEHAHISYSLLSEKEKVSFEKEYLPLVNTNPLIKLLYSRNQYGLSSLIEGHAEVYRYIGQQMPEFLKKYYPKLF